MKELIKRLIHQTEYPPLALVLLHSQPAILCEEQASEHATP